VVTHHALAIQLRSNFIGEVNFLNVNAFTHFKSTERSNFGASTLN
jgi:hypothetical protein